MGHFGYPVRREGMAVGDSAVKTYVDDYISSALEGITDGERIG